MTNKQYATRNRNFNLACERFNIKPTVRQASKYRRGKGAIRKMEKHQPCHVPSEAKLLPQERWEEVYGGRYA